MIYIFHLFLGRFWSNPGGRDDPEESDEHELDAEPVDEELVDRDLSLEPPLLPEELEQGAERRFLKN